MLFQDLPYVGVNEEGKYAHLTDLLERSLPNILSKARPWCVSGGFQCAGIQEHQAVQRHGTVNRSGRQSSVVVLFYPQFSKALDSSNLESDLRLLGEILGATGLGPTGLRARFVTPRSVAWQSSSSLRSQFGLTKDLYVAKCTGEVL